MNYFLKISRVFELTSPGETVCKKCSAFTLNHEVLYTILNPK